MDNFKKPFILISNDDGYHANGIKTLVRFLKDKADLLVVAPESARSGFSCAFSATTPLRLKRRHLLIVLSLHLISFVRTANLISLLVVSIMVTIPQ